MGELLEYLKKLISEGPPLRGQWSCPGCMTDSGNRWHSDDCPNRPIPAEEKNHEAD